MIGTILVVLTTIAVTVFAVWSFKRYAPQPRPQNHLAAREYTKADLERGARRDWDEQVKALGGSDPELYFSKPCLSGERTIFAVGGLAFKEYHAAALERFYAFSEGGFIDPSHPTTNELNS